MTTLSSLNPDQKRGCGVLLSLLLLLGSVALMGVAWIAHLRGVSHLSQAALLGTVLLQGCYGLAVLAQGWSERRRSRRNGDTPSSGAPRNPQPLLSLASAFYCDGTVGSGIFKGDGFFIGCMVAGIVCTLFALGAMGEPPRQLLRVARKFLLFAFGVTALTFALICGVNVLREREAEQGRTAANQALYYRHLLNNQAQFYQRRLHAGRHTSAARPRRTSAHTSQRKHF